MSWLAGTQAPIQPRMPAPTSASHAQATQAHPHPLAQRNVAQPGTLHPSATTSRPRGQPGDAVQRFVGGEAFQLPPTLANFGSSDGKPLPEPVRQKMESFFGQSFVDVRVHVGPQASAIGALAYTQGSNLFFAPGQYDPDTRQGRQLLGHELAHVVQQKAGRVKNPFGSGIALVQDRNMEAEADRMGLRAAAHFETVQAKRAPPGPLSPKSPSRIPALPRPSTIQRALGGGGAAAVNYLPLLGLTNPRGSDTQQIDLTVAPPVGHVHADSLNAWNQSRTRQGDSFVGVTDLSTMTHHMYPSFNYYHSLNQYRNARADETLSRVALGALYGNHFIDMDMERAPAALRAQSGIQHATVAGRVGLAPGDFIGWSIVGTAHRNSRPEVRFVSGRNTTKFRGRALSFGSADQNAANARDERDMPTAWRARIEADLARDLNLVLVGEGIRQGHHHRLGRTADFRNLVPAVTTEACNLRADANVNTILTALPMGTAIRLDLARRREFSLGFFSFSARHVWAISGAHAGWVKTSAVRLT